MYANEPFTVLEIKHSQIPQEQRGVQKSFAWYYVEVGLVLKKKGWLNSIAIMGKDVEEWL
jgi:hypothetical protein